MLFSTVMGMTGYALVIDKFATIIQFPVGVQTFFTFIAFGVYILILFLYLSKINLHPKDFYKEISNPDNIGFIAISSAATTLIATALLPYSESLSLTLWGIGAGVQLVLMVRIVSLWISYPNNTPVRIGPNWFIPAVGCLIIPMVGVKSAPVEISWFFFSIGILFWIVMLPIYFYRNICYHTIEENLTPTLFILMAPPSAGTIAWLSLTGEIDSFTRILYSISLFFLLVAVMQYKRYMKMKSFNLSWWSFSFPLATSILATLTMADALDSYFLLLLGCLKFVTLSLVILLLIGKTIQNILKNNAFTDINDIDTQTEKT